MKRGDQMTDLATWLLEQIDTDERIARAAVIPAFDGDSSSPRPELSRWRYREHGEVEYDYDTPDDHRYGTPYLVTCDSEGVIPAVDEIVGPHIAEWDPARVLAECDAKRRIVALDICMACDIEYQPCGHREDTLRILALPYADRPGYQSEWRPND